MGHDADVASVVQAAILAKVKPRKGTLHVAWLPAGILAIEGQVTSLADKQLADAAAQAAAARTPLMNALDIDFVPDEELTASSRAALHGAGIASLGVHVENGIAILGGRSEGLAVLRKAREALSRVSGIRGVRHDRVVLHMDRERAEIENLAALEDWDILGGVRYALAERLGQAVAALIVPTCRNGVVTLTGIVDRHPVREQAEDSARKTYGVESVRNLIMTREEPPHRAEALERRIRQALGKTGDTKPAAIHVYLVEEVAYVHGRVAHKEEAWQAMALAREEPGIGQVFDCLAIGDQGLSLEESR